MVAKSDKEFFVPADSDGRNNMMRRLYEKYGEISVYPIAKSIMSRPIDAVHIGEGEMYVCIFAAHHALESVTSNIAYMLVDYLLYGTGVGRIYDVDCKLLLSKYCFIIVPCVNPDGIELRYHGASGSPIYDRQMRMSGGDFSTWQANARGVDLNHNYDAGFYRYAALARDMGIMPGASRYGGEYPESEPESRGVANLVRTIMPSAVISLHSQGEEIYAFPDTPRVSRVAKRISAMTGYSIGVPEGTAAFSGLCDYTASLGIPSFTFEVGRGKNPLPESDVSAIFERIGKAIVTLPTLL